MTLPTRITKRTPVVTIPARELIAGATIVTRSGNVHELAAVQRTRDGRVRIGLANRVALTSYELPAHAPVAVFANE